jgi:DNA-binding PadR family transcriptional regulator
MVDADWGHTEQGKRAKFYRLTAAGRRELRTATAQWERYAAGMAGVLTAEPRST